MDPLTKFMAQKRQEHLELQERINRTDNWMLNIFFKQCLNAITETDLVTAKEYANKPQYEREQDLDFMAIKQFYTDHIYPPLFNFDYLTFDNRQAWALLRREFLDAFEQQNSIFYNQK